MTQMMMVWQVGECQQAKAVMPGRPFTIGRHPGCDVVLGDPHVSRLHATVLSENGGYVLQNVSRTNPVVFNRDLALKEQMRTPLQAGDSFVIGGVQITAMASSSSSDLWNCRCVGCGHTVELSRNNCPWCGLPLSGSKPLVKIAPMNGANGSSQ